jgi:hypothetical protein
VRSALLFAALAVGAVGFGQRDLTGTGGWFGSAADDQALSDVRSAARRR